MTFEKAIEKVIKCNGEGIRRSCWKDKTLRITSDKQFAGARVVPRGQEAETMLEMQKDIQKKRETIYDNAALFYQSDKMDFSDGGVYSGKTLKIGYCGDGLPYGKEDYLAKDWELYSSKT